MVFTKCTPQEFRQDLLQVVMVVLCMALFGQCKDDKDGGLILVGMNATGTDISTGSDVTKDLIGGGSCYRCAYRCCDPRDI